MSRGSIFAMSANLINSGAFSDRLYCSFKDHEATVISKLCANFSCEVFNISFLTSFNVYFFIVLLSIVNFKLPLYSMYHNVNAKSTIIFVCMLIYFCRGGGVKMDINKCIGLLLKSKREDKGYSLSQAGELINRSKTCIYYWETGRNTIDVVMLDKICKAYGTDMYSFLDELKAMDNGKV